MIRTENLSVDLGRRRVLDAVTLDLQRGRVTAILGANGAGKTSLLRAIAGLVKPSAGQIILDGQSLAALSLPERARRIGYLPQNGQPAWALSVRELVALGRLPHRSPFAALSPSDDAAIDAAMAQTDVAGLADRTVDTLSGGEKARAKFARVLAAETDWILADEPLANLDPPHQQDVLRLMRAAADAGKGVLVVLHQLDAAARVADDLLILKDGHAIAFGPCAEVLTSATLEAAFDMPLDVITHQGRVAILPR
jgi:iron complex transport system ATP-binding protein